MTYMKVNGKKVYVDLTAIGLLSIIFIVCQFIYQIICCVGKANSRKC